MRTRVNLSKIALAAFAAAILSSCNKQPDELTNIPAYRKDTKEAQVIDVTSYNSNTVLEDRVNGVDYIISNEITVNANLTIKPGVTLMFADGAGLVVSEPGSITAIGFDGNEVYFTSESGKRGAWKGITILSDDVKNVLSYCKIEHGAAENTFGTADVVVGMQNNTATAEISNCEITASKTDGVFVSDGSQLVNFKNNHIHTNTGFPVTMHVADANAYDNSNLCNNNGNEFIRLYAGNTAVNRLIALENLNMPYLLTGSVIANNGFIITPGVTMNMDDDASVVIDGVNGNGYFNAVGTAGEPIRISAVANGNGAWSTIRFTSSSSNKNSIEYCRISGGGAASDGAISVIDQPGKSTKIVVRNSSITNSAGAGIYIESANCTYNNDITTSNTFANNADANVQIGQ